MPNGKDFRVVGIGASAGGLESLERFFAEMPANPGAAFVVVQHLSPDFRSMMTELLSRHCELPIQTAEDGVEVEVDSVYLLPPRKEITIDRGRLWLSDKNGQALTLPIDLFFRSLAAERGPKAVAIVLSASLSDGARAVGEVKRAGGLVLAEDPESAKFDGMPLSALATGVVDFSGSAEDLARYLINGRPDEVDPEDEVDPDDSPLDRVLSLLRRQFGLDFSQYKHSTVSRRVLRRVTMLEEQGVEDYLERLNRDPDELGALYSELRNPLSAVLNATKVMRQADEESRDRAGGVIERQSKHMARLLDDLLDVARIARGGVELKKADIDLREPIGLAVEAVSPNAIRRSIEIHLDLPGEPLAVRGDPARLQQIVANLLTNAIKYSPAGAAIELAARCEGDRQVIVVSDQGCGITAELLPQIFELFVQTEQGLDRSDGGLGVGLALVRQLVELHGGEVTARSDGPGQGSEFRVELPLQASAILAPPPAEVITERPRRVVVVEDQEDSREMLAMLLESRGYLVFEAKDGAEAIEIIERVHPDVALIDLGLPRIDGFEVARRLRGNGIYDDVVLVALTGYGTDEDIAVALEAGFTDHVTKPADPRRLEQVLQQSR